MGRMTPTSGVMIDASIADRSAPEVLEPMRRQLGVALQQARPARHREAPHASEWCGDREAKCCPSRLRSVHVWRPFSARRLRDECAEARREPDQRSRMSPGTSRWRCSRPAAASRSIRRSRRRGSALNDAYRHMQRSGVSRLKLLGRHCSKAETAAQGRSQRRGQHPRARLCANTAIAFS